jgi:hypothetical protein
MAKFNDTGSPVVVKGFNCIISNGSCTYRTTSYANGNPVISPINCTDPLAAASPHTAVGEIIDFDLGTLDSRRAPYKIKIILDDGHLGFTISFKPFPLLEGKYIVSYPKPLHNDSFIKANLELSLGKIQPIKYDFVSPKG